ncbi:MAG: hypothetical protein P1P82_15280 [Bacteroidales bacterium]|nr:hypothetical protein [Bacteroidales bacterium]
MKHIQYLLLFLVLFIAGCGAGNTREAMQKPNILIILSDHRGNSDAGYQRSPSIVSTPAIDEIARDRASQAEEYPDLMYDFPIN